MSPTRRTYPRDVIEASSESLDAGDFSDEWRSWRHLAAMEAGILFPPEGTKWDQWDDDAPSQRAMLIRAIRETPNALEHAIRHARRPNWFAVLDGLLGVRDRLTEDIELDERDIAHRRRDEPSSEESRMVLRDVMRRIAE